MPRSEVLPRPGQKFGSRFLLHAHLWDNNIGFQSQSQAWNSPKKWVSEVSIEWVQIHWPWRKNTNEIQWQVKSEWKNTKMWRAKGKAMNTNTGGSPGYQNQSNSLEIHLVRKWGGHWTPTGTEPMDQWMGWDWLIDWLTNYALDTCWGRRLEVGVSPRPYKSF